MAIAFRSISDKDGSYGFRTLTFPALKHRLDFDPTHGLTLAVGARSGDRPCGLIMASVDRPSQTAEILSVFVSADRRRCGIASGLLWELESQARDQALRKLTANFRSDVAARPALDALVRRHGFSPPEPHSLLVQVTAGQALETPWLRPRKLPQGYEIIRWTEVPQGVRDALASRDERYDWILPALHPLRFEHDCEAHTSLALLRGGELRAWCINHRVGGALRFSCNFAHPEQQRLALITQLWRQAALLMQARGWQDAIWTVSVDQPRMFAFAKRHMTANAQRVAEFLETQKEMRQLGVHA
ncbi:MAG: GNAT family N-acetyltransferase [bacterium]|nr:GNAT family N-acetyltransferase [bacterium]